MKSFLELTKYIFTIPGVKFFLSERLSQDPIENFFGCQRQRGRTSENPNVYDFCKNTQALRVINSVCGNFPRGNCRGNKDSVIDIQKESKPLPKRCRDRKKCKSKENLLPEHDTSIPLNSKTLSVQKLHVHNIAVCTSLEQCEDNPLVEEDDHSDNEGDHLDDEDDHLDEDGHLEDEVNQSDDDDDQLEDGHEDIEAEGSQSEGMLCLTESDELSDTPDISDEMFLSDEEETCELQSVLIPTESPKNELTMPKLCEPSKSDSSFLSKMAPLSHVEPLKWSASSCTNEKPICHNFRQKTPVRSQLHIHTDVQEKMINEALGGGTSNEVMVKCFSIALQRHDMQTLNESGWLNDQVNGFV